MVDLHSHIAYGWDDGAKTLEDSMEMARMAAEDGIRVLAATPHMLWQNARVEPDVVRERVAEINEHVAAEGLNLRVITGTEMPATWESLAPLKHKLVLTLNDSRTVLFETPFNQLPVQFKDLVFQVRLAGFVPLLAHPERSGPFLSEPDLFYRLVDEDMPIQVTAGSLTGSFGERVEEFAWELVETERPVVVASDAHGVKRRRPVMSEARALLVQRYGEDVADMLCRTNAAALIENKLPRIAPIRRERPGASESRPGFGSRLRRLFRGPQ